MKQYELVLVLDGKVTAAKRKAFLEKMEKMVKAFEGKIDKTDEWGVKPLAYPIKKLDSGFYMILEISVPGSGAKNINEKLRLEEDVVRYLLVTKEKELVRIKNRTKELKLSDK